jgi:UDP-glucose 4-epimerase
MGIQSSNATIERRILPPPTHALAENTQSQRSGNGSIVVSGANGFLGRHCCRSFATAGFEVRGLVRNPDANDDLRSSAPGGLFHCDLPGAVDDAAFQGDVQAFVHCAYATVEIGSNKAQRTNIEGTEALMRFARKSNVRQKVFISSLSAHPRAASLYGRTKLRLEKLFNSASDTIIKPGTIIGNGGVFERTREMLGRLPVVPLFFANRQLQTVWIGDVCNSILAAVQGHVFGSLVIAHPKGVPLPEFYRRIAALDGRKVRFLPFPGDLAVLLTSLLEKSGIQLPIHSDNLLGMKHLEWFDPAPDLARVGIDPLSFEASIELLEDHTTHDSRKS